MGRPPSERWKLVREVCDANPGRWVHVTDHGHASWASQIKRGRISSLRPAGDYDAILRNGNGVIGSIYVQRRTHGSEEGQHGRVEPVEGVQPGGEASA